MTANRSKLPRTPMRSMTLPGAGRVVMRRSAKDPASGLNAYIVKNSDGKPCNVSVALKRKDRYIGCVLKGHPNGIVDMEFLQTPPESLIFTLGTCDQDGVVFLWFLRLVKDKLGIDFELRVLRKYSFYSLRKNKTAYYNRIRLAGTPEEGTMVLVPNDGSDVRVISFSCEPLDDPGYPALAAPTSVPLIEAAAGHVGNTPTLAVLPPPTEHKSTELQMPTPQPVAQDQHTKSRSALGTDPADEEESGTGHSARAYAVGAAAAAGAAIGAAAIAASDSSEESEEEEVVEDEEVEEDVDVKDPLNSTFPLSRRVEETLVDDDIAEAAARGAGLTGSSLRTGGVPRDEVEVYEAEGEYEEDEYEEEEYEEEEYEEEGYQGEVVGQRRGVPATAARGT